MKKITSLSLGFSFLIMAYTGIMLFIVPHGRVAYWSDWHLLGLSKSQYGDLHTTSMVTFLLFAMLHIYYNWKPLMSYMKNTSKKISFTKKEFLIALSLNLLFVIGTLTMVPPFKTFLDFGESIKEGWTQEYGEPPYGHAEETKLNIFCKKMSIDLSEAKKALDGKGMLYKDTDSLKTIARANGVSPNVVFSIIKPKSLNTKRKGVPSSLGRKTLQELDDMGKIDIKKAMKTLNAKGLSDVTKNSKMKNIADELDISPIELYKELSK